MPSSLINRLPSFRNTWKKRADAGDVNAQYSVGMGFFDGTGGYPQDQEEGHRYLTMAAQKGHRMAKLKLGDIYFEGTNGVEKNYQDASFWFKSLASGGDGSAMFKLFQCYKEGGPGLEQNKKLALEWLLKAHTHKHAGCKSAIVKLQEELEKEEKSTPISRRSDDTDTSSATDSWEIDPSPSVSYCNEKFQPNVLDLLYCHSSEPSDADSALKFHEELVACISNFPEFKFYYTWLRASVYNETITLASAKDLLLKTLESIAPLCNHEDALVQFKLVLDKCRADKLLSDEDSYRLDNRAELKRIQYSDFMIDMMAAITSNTQRLDGLDGTVEAMMKNIGALDSNIRGLQGSLEYKMRMEAGASMIKAVLNAVSFGVAGEIAELAAIVFNKVVDFGDTSHMFQIIQDSAQDPEEGEQLAADLQTGVQLASGLVDASTQEATDRKLKQALQERKAFVAIGFVATAMHPLVPPEPSVPEFGTPGFKIWKEAIFNEEQEDPELELHCSVKFGDKETLESFLSGMSAEKISRTDSQGRTATDLAAYTGQPEFVVLLEEQHGIPLKRLHRSKMKIMVAKRSKHAKRYLKYIEDSVSPVEVPGKFEMWEDAIFKEDSEHEDLGLHSSVKFSDKEELTLLLASMPEETMTKIDSRGRTATDLAAFTGQTDMVALLEEHGVRFSKHTSKMKAIARKRSKFLKEYKKFIWEMV